MTNAVTATPNQLPPSATNEEGKSLAESVASMRRIIKFNACMFNCAVIQNWPGINKRLIAQDSLIVRNVSSFAKSDGV